MSIQHIVYGIVTSSLPLVALVGDRVFEANALGVSDQKKIPAKPFLVIRYGEERPGPVGAIRVVDRLADFYVYQDPGSYDKINKVIRLLANALHDRSGDSYVDPDTDEKTWLVSSRYQGSSPDLLDDIYRANTRYCTYRFVGSTAAV